MASVNRSGAEHMSPAYVLEPTYDTLRRRLFAGVWPSGQRLEAARLATELGVSMTPVRDSLNRLAGERLVHSSPGEGFQVPLLSETELRSEEHTSELQSLMRISYAV